MKLFRCQACEQVLYFENTRCERCQHTLGYLPEAFDLSALEPDGEGRWRALAEPSRQYRYCANAAHDACNWLVPADRTEEYCAACRHNRTIPDLTDSGNLLLWRKMQFAQHRLMYTLMRLKLDLRTRAEDPEGGLVFDMLADPADPNAPKVMTGHDEGVITLALAEADDAERERRRTQLGEPYRTLLGHFRHEVGHWYWNVLVRDGGRLEDCRQVFGDEREDYGEALKRHYASTPPADWRDHYVSTYANAHPWEDWAETWAHYLHIVDTLEMAGAFGLRVRPPVDAELSARVDFDPYADVDIGRVIEAWLPITFAMNSLNRCMGESDLYPFILSPEVVGKMGFIHELVHAASRRNKRDGAAPAMGATLPADRA